VTTGGDPPPAGRLPGLIAIGVVRSARHRRADTPVQAALNRSEVATIEIEARFSTALMGLEGFDYAWVISWLGTDGDPGPEEVALRQVPFLLQATPREIGVLATRGPRRINPIGLSLVRILEVGVSSVRFAGVDLIDGTAVVDIKPFVARFDRPEGDVACGWFDTVDLLDGSTPASLDPAT
jgi:tRNA-Thr(GGU) m(6)t(6)A37 methyltransferase TsaA